MNANSQERIILTADGSHSLYNAELGQHYHSKQGALQESTHIFIKLGLIPLLETAAAPVKIFEMGFGSGLNALLAWQQADLFQQQVQYVGIEAYPVAIEEAELLNFDSITGKTGIQELHRAEWSQVVRLSDYFSFRKEAVDLQSFEAIEPVDLVFYDAFSPSVQPELWTEEVFRKIAGFTAEDGVLVTYCSKGVVRRALQAAGFRVEKYPGPGYKREVVKAIRIGQ
jgi:tRNA U34 5-methylaminomethyl-2-thiouridine-forming methyltransferase MnmC